LEIGGHEALRDQRCIALNVSLRSLGVKQGRLSLLPAFRNSAGGQYQVSWLCAADLGTASRAILCLGFPLFPTQ